MDGFLVLNKPLGKTSSDCVVFVRRRLPRGTAIGHGGTLDPMASGVLPVCVGAATRLFDYIIDKQKTYVAELQLGVATDTQDATGAVKFPVTLAEAVRIPGGKTLDQVTQFPAQICTGSYVGTGTYGKDDPTEITFPFVPDLWGYFANVQILSLIHI